MNKKKYKHTKPLTILEMFKKVYEIKNGPVEMLYKTNKVMLQPFSAFPFCCVCVWSEPVYG